MFMFRCRRNALVKRLWRAARVMEQLQQQQQQQQQQEMEQQQVHKKQLQWKAATHALFKRFSEQQLHALVAAIESAGAAATPCVVLDADHVAKNCPEPVHVLLCRIFRWPELRASSELKKITTLCHSLSDKNASTAVCCCNPYHWSRLSAPDMAPPPYSRLVMNLERPGRLAVVSRPVESLETGGTNQYSSSNTNLDGSARLRPWCTLAYWELRQRVGRLFPVTQPSVAIFSDAKAQDGLCLSALTSQKPPETDAVRRTRQKVGLGLLLCQESDGVWVYNRSENSVFVNSPTLDPPGPGPAGAPRTLLVYKVPAGFAIRIFDYERSQFYQQLALTSTESLYHHCELSPVLPQCYQTDDCEGQLAKTQLLPDSLTHQEDYSDGPFDPNALRISFAKGWGPKYSRQFITSCPCWVEVLLAPCR